MRLPDSSATCLVRFEGAFLILLGGREIAVEVVVLSQRILYSPAYCFRFMEESMLPLVLYPCETLSYFPYRLSFEEVYLIKDVGWDADC